LAACSCRCSSKRSCPRANPAPSATHYHPLACATELPPCAMTRQECMRARSACGGVPSWHPLIACCVCKVEWRRHGQPSAAAGCLLARNHVVLHA
jgi:hypothetical protein